MVYKKVRFFPCLPCGAITIAKMPTETSLVYPTLAHLVNSPRRESGPVGVVSLLPTANQRR